MLSKVELADEAFATETLVVGAGTRNQRPAASLPRAGSLASHHVKAETLHSELTGIECLTAGDECRIRLGAGGQADVAVVRTNQRHGVARAIVQGVAHNLDTQLVVSHLPEVIAVTDRHEVIELVNAAVTRERQDALFRE